jgi:hypothetical protein
VLLINYYGLQILHFTSVRIFCSCIEIAAV